MCCPRRYRGKKRGSAQVIIERREQPKVSWKRALDMSLAIGYLSIIVLILSQMTPAPLEGWHGKITSWSSFLVFPFPFPL